MYAIVEFESKELETMPLAWLVEGARSDSLQIGSRVNFYWPPMKSLQQIANAIKKCINPELSWTVYKARILDFASEFGFNFVVVPLLKGSLA